MYTRPRRFTVLFCMLLGNMVIIAIWTASGPQNFFQKIVGGVISAILMFPASFFFAWIFKKLDSTPNVKKDRNKQDQQQKLEKSQEILKPLKRGPPTVDKDGNPLSAPPEELKEGKRLPKKRGFIPLPNRTRISMPDGAQALFKRKRRVAAHDEPTASAASDPTPPPPPLAPQPATIREESEHGRLHDEFSDPVDTRSKSGSTSTTLNLHAKHPPLPPLPSHPRPPDTDEVGQYIPRRALPVHKGPHQPAPTAIRRGSDGSLGKEGSRASHSSHLHSTASTPPKQPHEMPLLPIPIPDPPSHPLPEGSTSSRSERKSLSGYENEKVRKAWGEESTDVRPHADEKDLHGHQDNVVAFGMDDDDDRRVKRRGIAGLVLGALDKPMRGLPKRQTFIDHRFEIAAYCLAYAWFLFCIYFCVLFGVTFPRSLQEAWVIGFVISIIQDLLVMETLKLGSQTGIQLFVKPQVVGWLAEQTMKGKA